MTVPMVHLEPGRLMAGASIFACLLCLGPNVTAEPSPVRVAVTVVPQGWLVERIGGEAVEVLVVVGAGESPETFQPTDAQVTDLSLANLYFRIGVPAERGPWFRALRSLSDLRMVDLREDLALRPMEEHSHGNRGGGHKGHDHDHAQSEPSSTEGLDPHVWLSPQRLATMAERVARELVAADPDRRSVYEDRRDRLIADLELLDAELRDQLAPLAGSAFLVFHPAWGYFAEDYDLRQVAIEMEGKEPSEIELTQLVREARELGTRAIFVQPQITGRTARSIAVVVGAEVVTTDPLARDVVENLRRVADLLVATAPRGSGAP